VGTLVEADTSVRDWARGVLDGVDITADPPAPAGAAVANPRVSLYLFELAGERELLGGRRRSPLRYQLRYLVTTGGGADGAAREVLGRLLDAAVEADELSVRLDPPDPQTWLALGAPPQPSFVLEAPASTERPYVEAPLVTELPIVRGSVLRPLHGRLVGPGGRSVPGATVAVVGTATAVEADRDGRFSLAAAPDDDGRARFRVCAKGREFVAEIDLSDGDDDVVIHFDPRET
jgi:hypothetical protein